MIKRQKGAQSKISLSLVWGLAVLFCYFYTCFLIEKILVKTWICRRSSQERRVEAHQQDDDDDDAKQYEQEGVSMVERKSFGRSILKRLSSGKRRPEILYRMKQKEFDQQLTSIS